MSTHSITFRKALAGVALLVSIISIGYLILGHSPAGSSISDLSLKITQIELGLLALQDENRALKEEGRMLRTALEGHRNVVPQAEESPAIETASELRSPAPPRTGAGNLESAHKNWIAKEYPKIVEKSLANAESMINILNSDTSIAKEKLAPMKNVFSEASIRIANVLANAPDMNDLQGINSQISEINQWKEGALSGLLSKEELEQYKGINWMKKMAPGGTTSKK